MPTIIAAIVKQSRPFCDILEIGLPRRGDRTMRRREYRLIGRRVTTCKTFAGRYLPDGIGFFTDFATLSLRRRVKEHAEYDWRNGMDASWARENQGTQKPPRGRAVAYYRQSAQGRREDSISVQQKQVRRWAEENGIEIIDEYVDSRHSRRGDL